MLKWAHLGNSVVIIQCCLCCVEAGRSGGREARGWEARGRGARAREAGRQEAGKEGGRQGGKLSTVDNCKSRSLDESVKDDRRGCSYINSHSSLFPQVRDTRKGQAVRELTECLWGKRYLGGFIVKRKLYS